MRVCIIGSNGFIATAIGAYFEKKGFDVTVIGRSKPSRYKYKKFYYSNLDLINFPFEKCNNFDFVFYCAAAGVQSNSDTNTYEAYYINTYFPITLFETLKIKRFTGVFVSFGSYFEIGLNSTNRVFSEEEVVYSTLPVPNAYCTSKRLLSRYYTSLEHENFYHFILPTIYGENEDTRRLLPYLILSFKNNSDIHLSKGDQIRQYLYIEDFLNLLFAFLLDSPPFGIYNFPCGEEVSVKDIVRQLCIFFHKELPESAFGNVEKTDEKMKILKLTSKKFCSIIKLPERLLIGEVINRYLKNGN